MLVAQAPVLTIHFLCLPVLLPNLPFLSHLPEAGQGTHSAAPVASRALEMSQASFGSTQLKDTHCTPKLLVPEAPMSV